MLMYALMGLHNLNRLGFSHNDVKRENLTYKLDWGMNLVQIKWIDYDCVNTMGQPFPCTTERIDDPLQYPQINGGAKVDLSHHDRFSFGIMIYEILFGMHPSGDLKSVDKTWKCSYQVTDTEKSHLHNNIRQLLQDNPLQPLSTVAYHFIVNEVLYPDEKRWNYDAAFSFMKEHPVDKQALPGLPALPNDGQLPPLPRPYVDW
jgi:serine/threonine protein kinase